MNKETNFIPSSDELVNDPALFNSFVYTPWSEAVDQLSKRRSDKTLLDSVLQLTNNRLPISTDAQIAALFRNVATPNYETIRFLNACDALTHLSPVLFEYPGDKFADINESKYSLAKLRFFKHLHNAKESIHEYQMIVDMTKANGKSISDVKTFWNEPLTEFHNAFLKEYHPQAATYVHDLSEWLLLQGKNSHSYYKAFMALFLRHGVLFENFLLYGHERNFTIGVIIPAFLDLFRETGHKPLIVRLEPERSEGNAFWYSYPYRYKKFVDYKKSLLQLHV